MSIIPLTGFGYGRQSIDDILRWAQDSPTRTSFSFSDLPQVDLKRRDSQTLQRHGSQTLQKHGSQTLQRHGSQTLQRRASQHLARRNSQRLVARRSFVVQRRPSSSAIIAPAAPSRRPSLSGRKPSLSGRKSISRKRSLSVRIPSFTTLWSAAYVPPSPHARASFCDFSVPLDGAVLDQFDARHEEGIRACMEAACADGRRAPRMDAEHGASANAGRTAPVDVGFMDMGYAEEQFYEDLPSYVYSFESDFMVGGDKAGNDIRLDAQEATVAQETSVPPRLTAIKEEEVEEVDADAFEQEIDQSLAQRPSDNVEGNLADARFDMTASTSTSAAFTSNATASTPTVAALKTPEKQRKSWIKSKKPWSKSKLARRKRSPSFHLTASPADIFGISPNGVYSYEQQSYAYNLQAFYAHNLSGQRRRESVDALPTVGGEDNESHVTGAHHVDIPEEDDERDDAPPPRRRRPSPPSESNGSDDEYIDDDYYTPRTPKHRRFPSSALATPTPRSRKSHPASYRSPIAHRPFPCSYPGCGHACINRNDLGRHMLKHVPAAWACYACGQQFTRKDALVRHVDKNARTAASCKARHLARAKELGLGLRPYDPFPKGWEEM
ncbi:hypothetical protein BD626DRAFT_174961 [Schizophyllum amplum]|uniref:C2H2-type domain-containing protein n=1 Tax=Schizophyllum amplum TaxID=97359 RepID=A0A550C2M9_9AGAR|nr:hypothetical protein BD626DRAFT_174961 [Auriculariopsis ampla]